MSPFRRLPGFVVTQPGAERTVLRLMPRVFFLGNLVVALPSAAARLLAWLHPETSAQQLVTTIDIYAIGVLVVHWTAVLTVTIGAIIVWVMKGPAYVADGYPVQDADAPRSQPPRG